MGLLDVLFIFALVSSILAFNFNLPGNFLVFIHTVWYKILSNSNELPFKFLVLLLVIAVLLEFLEYLVLVLTMKKYKASNMAIWFAVTGSVIGAFSGAFHSFYVGSVLGGFLGVIAGTVIAELVKKKNFQEIFKSVSGAFLGTIGGMIIKYIGVVTMISIVIYKLYM
jgi:uncharacterized protein YqgC (DUF456 family)